MKRPRWRPDPLRLALELGREPGAKMPQRWGRLVAVSMGEQLLDERRRRRRGGDPRVTPEGREILMRLVAGDLMGEFQAELDRISAEDPDIDGQPVTD